jgi:hypothetical protein
MTDFGQWSFQNLPVSTFCGVSGFCRRLSSGLSIPK